MAEPWEAEGLATLSALLGELEATAAGHHQWLRRFVDELLESGLDSAATSVEVLELGRTVDACHGSAWIVARTKSLETAVA